MAPGGLRSGPLHLPWRRLVSEFFALLRSALAPRYDLERELGAGGMGTVFLARDTRLGRHVAIKVLRQELATAVAIERFDRETHILAQFRHRHIVPIHDAGEAVGLPYYVMDFLEGETLEARLQRGPLPLANVVTLGRQMLSALGAAHRRGIIHRDIKPSNIFLEEDGAVLTDFGVAKTLGDPAVQLTVPGQLTGTIPYMPPEQLAGGLVTPRTDLYALAMVLYEAATGRQWSIGDKLELVVQAGLPRRLALALQRALAWYPEDRWPDAASFEKALAARTPVVPAGIVVGALATLGIVVYLFRCSLFGCGQLVRVVLREAGARSALADSIACEVAEALDALFDVRARCSGQRSPVWSRVTVLEGDVDQTGDTLSVTVLGQDPPMRPVQAGGLRTEQRELVGRLVQEIYTRVLVDWPEPPLPSAILPKNPTGLRLFVEAERLVKEARWALA